MFLYLGWWYPTLVAKNTAKMGQAGIFGGRWASENGEPFRGRNQLAG